MCAASNPVPTPSQVTSNHTKSASKPVPKWLKMKQQNKSSAGKTVKPTVQKSSGSAQKPSEGTRNEKRARWAKKAVPKQRPVAPRRENTYEYISVCCGVVANKPRCGMKVASVDPETGRPAKKEKSTGLGHFRCSQCHKACKVKPQAPTVKATAGTIGGTVPDVVYPAPLHTPVLEVPTAPATV
jgi:hypothetical protein